MKRKLERYLAEYFDYEYSDIPDIDVVEKTIREGFEAFESVHDVEIKIEGNKK